MDCMREAVLPRPCEHVVSHDLQVCTWYVQKPNSIALTHFPCSFLPYRYGIAGIVTSNSMIAGLLYIAYLVGVSMVVFDKLKKSDPKGAQNRVLAFDCAFIATAGISFYCNVSWNCALGVTGTSMSFFPASCHLLWFRRFRRF